MTEGLLLVHTLIWGPWTVFLFLGVGLVFTIRFHFFQVRGFTFWWRATFGTLFRKKPSKSGEEKKSGEKKVSQFQSVCTALAATVGTGNIAGVATALTAGGPGALFWMWVSALIGMITAYTETVLGLRYRQKEKDGSFLCGPFLYMKRGLSMRGLGVFYGVCCLMCAFGMGSMVQSNSAVETMAFTWNIPPLAGGACFCLFMGLVILGGIRRIGNVAEKLMPAASGIYLFFSLFFLLTYIDRVPDVFASIFSSAFSFQAAAGGAAGYGIRESLRYGISRGVFSNEAGLGTLAVLHGSAEDTTPYKQGMWAMFEVFFDTILLCTVTGLVILCMAGNVLISPPCEGAALAAWCFEKRFGMVGNWFVSASMVVFAFATVMAWFYVGRQAAVYVSRECKAPVLLKCYPFAFLLAVFSGGIMRLEAVWLLSDIWNGMMAFPNLTALLFLMGEVELPPEWKKRTLHKNHGRKEILAEKQVYNRKNASHL